jgi:hypothetical protein
MTSLACAAFERRLAQWDDTAAAHAASADPHLATCARCRALAADLSAIRTAAGALPAHRVPPAVWERLRPMVTARPATPRGAVTVGAPWLAAAAALLVAIGGALGMLVTGGRVAPADEAVAQVAADLDAAEAHYLRAIAGLERLARMDDPALAPDVARVLQANLQALDGAIRETRAALASRPDDDVARRGLFDALDGKVALLEQTVSLIDAERVLEAPAARSQD